MLFGWLKHFTKVLVRRKSKGKTHFSAPFIQFTLDTLNGVGGERTSIEQRKREMKTNLNRYTSYCSSRSRKREQTKKLLVEKLRIVDAINLLISSDSFQFRWQIKWRKNWSKFIFLCCDFSPKKLIHPKQNRCEHKTTKK